MNIISVHKMLWSVPVTESARTVELPSTDAMLAAVGRGIQAFVMVESWSGVRFCFHCSTC